MSPRRVLLLLALYGTAHVGLRLLVSPVLTIDDAREAVLAQTLAPGYLPRQPPLYNWLAWGADRLLGPGVLGLTLVKYGCLVAALGFLYLAARRALGDGRLAAPAALSVLLVVPVNWVIHQTLTHNVAALAAAAATLWLVLRLETAARPADYAALGLAVAAGTLAKFNYLFFLAALLAAALTVPAYRARLLRPAALLVPGLAALLALPYAAWFAGRGLSLVAIAAEEIDRDVPGGAYPAGVATGLYFVARVALYYAVPLVPAFLLAFPGARAARPAAAASAAHRLLGRTLLAAGAILVAGALGGTLTYLTFRWLLPAVVPLPLWLFTRLDGGRADARRLRRYLAVLLAVELLVLAGIAADVLRGDRLGRPSRLNVPYDRIAAELRAAGFTRGTIVAGEGPLAGNLRIRFPRSRVIRLTNPDYVPPRARADGQCLVVWDRERDPAVPAALRAWAEAAVGLRLAGDEPVRHFAAVYRHAGRARHNVRWVLLPEGRGDCR